MWLKITAFSIGVLALAFAGAYVWGARRWGQRTHAIRARLESTRRPLESSRVTFRELDNLPAPVQRYLRAALTDGQPIIAAASIEHSGTFNMGTDADRWRPFTSTQRVITRPPGFDWNGRIAMFPGMPATVHDAYIAGEGLLQAALLGLISVADMRGSRDLAEGELLRFLAEGVWYPTALLPSQGVRWAGIDDRSAMATLADGPIAVRLTFEFDAAGLVTTVRADARGRSVGGAMVPTPWTGRFWNYAEIDGVLIPLDGEVAWVLPEGPKPYWRGHVETLSYETSPVATPKSAR
jgi:hypothetical protein